MHTAFRPAVAMLLAIFLGALVAAGCGSDGDSGGDGKKSAPAEKEDRSNAAELGMDEDAICTVYEHIEIESDDVEDRASMFAELIELMGAVDDADDVELADDDGAGDLEPLEVYALRGLVEDAVTRHAADEEDIDEPDDDDVLEDFAKDAFDADVEEGEDVLDAADDEVAGIKEKVLAETATVMLLEELRDPLDLDDDAATSDVLDDVLDAAEDDDAVVCGDDVEFFETDGFLETADGEDLEPRDSTIQLLVESRESIGAPEPGTDSNQTGSDDPPAPADPAAARAAQGAKYERDVVPVIDDFVPLLKRLESVIAKLDAGTISIESTATGFRRQAGFSEQLAQRVLKVKSADPYLMKANRSLAAGFSAYADALNALGSLDEAKSEADVNRLLETAQRNITKMDTSFNAWETALDADPHGRSFPKAAAAAARVETTATALKF